MSQIPTLSRKHRLAIARLVVAPDGADYVLGRPDLRLYVAVPAAGAVFIERLRSGSDLAEATARASEVAGEPVDGVEFWSGLGNAGLLDPPSEDPSDGYRISPRQARRLFGPVAWSVYGMFAVFTAVVLVLRADLRPTFESAWFLADPILSLLLIVPVGLSLSALHESWHWLAGRSEGISGVFRISFRGPFLVFETDLTQIVLLPRRRRYGPFLAGMAVDVTVLGLVLMARLGFRLGFLPVPASLDRFLGAVVLILVYAIVWQWAAVFLRSDGYAVMANLLGCHNLYRTTFLVNRWRLWKVTEAQQAELAAVSERDRRAASWFGLVQLIGMAVVGWTMLTIALPFLIGISGWLVGNLAARDLSSWVFWESLAALGYLALVYFGPLLLVLRQRGLSRIEGRRS